MTVKPNQHLLMCPTLAACFTCTVPLTLHSSPIREASLIIPLSPAPANEYTNPLGLVHLTLPYSRPRTWFQLIWINLMHGWFSETKQRYWLFFQVMDQRFPKGQTRGMWLPIGCSLGGLCLVHDGSQCSPAVGRWSCKVHSDRERTACKASAVSEAGSCCSISKYHRMSSWSRTHSKRTSHSSLATSSGWLSS